MKRIITTLMLTVLLGTGGAISPAFAKMRPEKVQKNLEDLEKRVDDIEKNAEAMRTGINQNSAAISGMSSAVRRINFLEGELKNMRELIEALQLQLELREKVDEFHQIDAR